MAKIALVGKPNSGKSSLFNLLTGLNQKIGNYPGVTVEKKSGVHQGKELIDLPGLKSLWVDSIDEKISLQQILDYAESKNPIIFVANGLQLEDSLLLFSEVADLQIPAAFVINFKDEIQKSQMDINLQELKASLGCEVLMISAKTGEGLGDLKSIIQQNKFKVPHTFCRSQYEKVFDGQYENTYIKNISTIKNNFSEEQFALLDKDFSQRQVLTSKILNKVVEQKLDTNTFISKTKKIDRLLLHPIFGTLIFLIVLLVVFQSVFTLSRLPSDWIDMAFGWMSEQAESKIKIPWLADLMSNGILAGLGGVLIFIPQIAILFFLLSVLEHSGYLSRISYISDNFLRKFGLSGKSIIPLMSSWACAIPAIMSTRMIEDKKERWATIMAAPLMTCSARLPVYTILIAVMFPEETDGFINLQGLTLFGLYLIGVIATLVVALFVSKYSKEQSDSLWSLELPIYRWPNWRGVWTNVYNKTKSFVIEAGKVIFLISIVLWFLASFSPKSEGFIDEKYVEYQEKFADQDIERASVALEYSYAGYLGKVIEPVIRPLGYDWKIGIAIITSFAAREVFVGTLSTIYSIGSEEEESIINRLRNETNLNTGSPRYDLATSFSLLLFYVFALQCMSTLAIVRKETGKWKHAIYQFLLMLVLAYVFALIPTFIF